MQTSGRASGRTLDAWVGQFLIRSTPLGAAIGGLYAEQSENWGTWMAVLWRIDHGALRIFATAQGSVARPDIEAYVREVIAQGAIGYQVVFDMRAASASLSRQDVAALSQASKDRQKHDRSDGRMALVASSEAERDMAAYFADLTSRNRACRLFSTIEDALAWLDQPPERPEAKEAGTLPADRQDREGAIHDPGVSRSST